MKKKFTVSRPGTARAACVRLLMDKALEKVNERVKRAHLPGYTDNNGYVSAGAGLNSIVFFSDSATYLTKNPLLSVQTYSIKDTHVYQQTLTAAQFNGSSIMEATGLVFLQTDTTLIIIQQTKTDSEDPGAGYRSWKECAMS